MTLGLCIISQDYSKELGLLLTELTRHFDEIYVQLNGKGVKLPDDRANIHFFKHKWRDDFADARNALLNEVKTDYWSWCDTDDTIDRPELFRSLVAGMEKDGVEVIDLPYEYAHNDLGECIVLQYRERLIKNDSKFYWQGKVHETVLAKTDTTRRKDQSITFIHHKSAAEVEVSRQRNHKLLLQAWSEEHDPRTAHYLGLSFYGLEQFDEAIKYFIEHVKTSGWPEEQYRSWIYVAQANKFLGQFSKAQRACNEALEILPEWPDAYLFKGQFYNETGDWAKAISWIKQGRDKPIPTNTLSAQDETLYTYRPLIAGALALLNLGQIKEAYAWYAAAAKLTKHELVAELKGLFESEYGQLIAIEKLQWLARYLNATGGSPAKLFEALPPDLSLDVRLNKERNKYLKPTVWSDRSIVFFCGESTEAWGPDMLTKGIGGSEEAVIYLSRELAKLGWEITIYCERDTVYEDGTVRYLPWGTLNPNDEFNIVVSWRRPTLFSAYKLKAKYKLVDLHDAPVGPDAISKEAVASVDRFMFKSQYQRQIASHIPDNKVAIAPNGIVPEHFDVDVKRNPLKVIYASTHDRGLDTLLELWPEIKKQVPGAELHTYYGWNTFDAIHHDNPERMKWKFDMMKRMHRAGVIDHGRLSHEDLAREFKSAGVWAYPTMFAEISCLTAMKAGAAGLHSVTSGYAALQETQLQGFRFANADMKDRKCQEEFIAAAVKALKEPMTEAERQKWSDHYREVFAWSGVATKWNEVLSGL